MVHVAVVGCPAGGIDQVRPYPGGGQLGDVDLVGYEVFGRAGEEAVGEVDCGHSG